MLTPHKDLPILIQPALYGTGSYIQIPVENVYADVSDVITESGKWDVLIEIDLSLVTVVKFSSDNVSLLRV